MCIRNRCDGKDLLPHVKKIKIIRAGRSRPAPIIIIKHHRESEPTLDVAAPFPIHPALIPLPLGSTKTSQAVHGQLLRRKNTALEVSMCSLEFVSPRK